MIIEKSITACFDKIVAIFPNHLAATLRPNIDLPPHQPPLLAARWFPRFGRCREKAHRSAGERLVLAPVSVIRRNRFLSLRW
jgi:hypothetical protein